MWSGYHYCITLFSKAWTQVLRWLKSCALHVGGLQWWETLRIVLAENKGYDRKLVTNGFRWPDSPQKQFIIIITIIIIIIIILNSCKQQVHEYEFKNNKNNLTGSWVLTSFNLNSNRCQQLAILTKCNCSFGWKYVYSVIYFLVSVLIMVHSFLMQIVADVYWIL